MDTTLGIQLEIYKSITWHNNDLELHVFRGMRHDQLMDWVFHKNCSMNFPSMHPDYIPLEVLANIEYWIAIGKDHTWFTIRKPQL